MFIKPYRSMYIIREPDMSLTKLYYVYASIHTISQFMLILTFAVCAYLYDPTHKLMIFHWLPYVIMLCIWILSIFFIDLVMLMYENGSEMFDALLAGFTPRISSIFEN
jgi:hypothetical protein